MEFKTIIYIIILFKTLFSFSENMFKKPISEIEVLRFVLIESGLNEMFTLPIFLADDCQTPHLKPKIVLYDSLLSFSNFRIELEHFEHIGLNKKDLDEVIKLQNKRIPRKIEKMESIYLLKDIPDFGPDMDPFVIISRIYLLSSNQAVFAIKFNCYHGCGYLELYLVSKSEENNLTIKERLVVNLD